MTRLLRSRIALPMESDVGGTRVSRADPTWRRRVLRVSIGIPAFIAAGYLGRATVIDGQGLSLIWPAIGVAALWLGTGDRRTWPTDLAALAAATLTVNLTTGASPGLAVAFLLTNLIQLSVFVAIVRSRVPGLWGFGGTGQLSRLKDLGTLVIAAGVSGAAGIAFGLPGILAASDMPHPATIAVWLGRNGVAIVVIPTLLMLLLQPLVTSGSVRSAGHIVREALTPESAGRLAEVCGLISVTTMLSSLIFTDTSARPLGFLLLATSVWAGLRFASLAVTLHGMVMGVCGITFTLAGMGPFASIESLPYRALVAQGFVAMAVMTGLALSFSRAERDAADRELMASQRSAADRAQLLDAILESMNEGITVIDENGSIVVLNTAARELASLVGLVGPVIDHVQPAERYRLFHANGLPVEEEQLPGRRALAGETVEPVDLHLRMPDGVGGRVLEFTAQPLNSDDPSAPKRALVNTRDVTLDRQHRDTLASFAGVVAHDLLNPLSIVTGWTEALFDEFAQGPVSPAVGNLIVQRINGASVHMREFIGDLMSYTMARDQSLRSTPVDLTAMVRALAALREGAPSAPVIVVADNLQVWADEGLVRQMMDNLIGNAVKYTAPGVRPVVEVSGEVVDEWLEVRVSDNGIGIPESQRETVFENFHRIHGSEYGGTGLGLAICRRIADRHGGSIHLVGGPHGRGTTAVFRLPRLAPVPQATLSPARAGAGSYLRP